MRVLILTQYYPPEVGATQTRLHHFAGRLAASGHQVTVITEIPNHPKGVVFEGYRGRAVLNTLEDGCRVIRVWVCASPQKGLVRRLLFYASYMINAVLAGISLARGRYDAVFASSPPLPVAVSGYALSRLKRCPFILDVRDIWPAVGVVLGELRGRALVRFAERLERCLYSRAADVTCVTRSFVDDAIRKGVPPDRVHFLPNGTIPELFTPDRVDPGLRRRLGLEGKFVVGFCGNHGVAQGLPEILETARLLRDDREFRFLFIGEGPVKPRLVEIVARDALDNVLLLPEVPLGEITPYINAADVMLVPLKADPIFAGFIPSKLFDFMACAKPVVLTVDGEARALLEEAGAGVYVEPGNPRALAEALIALRAQRARLQEMGRRGRTYVLERYVRDRQAERLERILAEAARAPHARAVPRPQPKRYR